MTDQATRIVPAGWYEDPASPAHVRWWNGLAWTEHVTLKPVTEPVTVAAAQEQGAETSWGGYAGGDQAAHYAGTGTDAGAGAYGSATISGYAAGSATESDYASAASGSYGTELRRDRSARLTVEPIGGTNTGSGWLIALSPVVWLLVAVIAGYVFFYLTPNRMLALAVLFPYLLVVLWAISDSRRLHEREYAAPSGAWALLGPLVYLIVRRIRVPGSGPLVTLIVALALTVGLPAAAWATGAATPVTTALQVQQEVSAELVGSGQAVSVSCPAFVESVRVGALYTCDVTLPDGGSRLLWVSIDSDDGDYSYAFAAN